MKKINALGKEIPPYMLGTWAWGRGSNGSSMVFGKKRDEAALYQTFAEGVRLGFNLWDTAEVYGMGTSEMFLSDCMSKYGNVIISDKFAPQGKYQKGKAARSLEASLARLGVESIELYWLHSHDNFREYIPELVELQKNGKIKSIGISNFLPDEVKEAARLLTENGSCLAAVQNHFSLLSMPSDQLEIIDWCNKNNVTYFAYMVLEQGALSGRYNAKHHFPTFSLRNLQFGKSKFHKIQPLLECIDDLSAKYNVDKSQIAIMWAVGKGTVPIIGVTKPSHVKALAESSELSLSDEDMHRLESEAAKAKLLIKGIWEPKN